MSLNSYCQTDILPLEFDVNQMGRISIGVKWESIYNDLPDPISVHFDGDTLTLLHRGADYLKTKVVAYRYVINKGKKTYTLEILKYGFRQYIIIESGSNEGKTTYGIMIPYIKKDTGEFQSYKAFK